VSQLFSFNMVSSHVSTNFSCYHKCILLQWQCKAIDVCPWNQLHDPPVPTLLISHSSQDHTTTESYSLYPLQTHKNLWYIGQEEQHHNSKDKHTQLKHSTTTTNTPPHSLSINADEPDKPILGTSQHSYGHMSRYCAGTRASQGRMSENKQAFIEIIWSKSGPQQ
jgi:hypothetical protein